jgi:hypothetical protein
VAGEAAAKGRGAGEYGGRVVSLMIQWHREHDRRVCLRL